MSELPASELATFVPVVFSGADSRLESEVETSRDTALHFEAPADGARVALYGPFIDLPPGMFRIELEFAVSKRSPGDVKIELCHSGSVVKLYQRPCFDWEIDAGSIRLSYPFADGVRGLEVRLIVPPGFAASIRQLSFTRLK